MSKHLPKLLLLARTLISVVLIYAGFNKALAPVAEFAALINLYQLLPTAALTPIAFGLPWIEMWIGLFLLTGLYTRWAAAAAAGLFSVFIGAISLSFWRGIDLKDCGCFGAGSFPPHVTLGMDVVLFSLCLWIVWKNATPLPYTLDKKLS